MGNTRRFFIALLPPSAMQNYANQIRQHFADHYGSRKAFNSPPHITLQAPFEWPLDRRDQLLQSLAQFAQKQPPVTVTLQGFGAFPPRVIFIHVLPSIALLELQERLKDHFDQAWGMRDCAFARPFIPHMTVAFRDLTKANFRRAWPQLQQQPLGLTNRPDEQYQFVARSLTLLQHDGQCWQVNSQVILPKALN